MAVARSADRSEVAIVMSAEAAEALALVLVVLDSDDDQLTTEFNAIWNGLADVLSDELRPENAWSSNKYAFKVDETMILKKEGLV